VDCVYGTNSDLVAFFVTLVSYYFNLNYLDEGICSLCGFSYYIPMICLNSFHLCTDDSDIFFFECFQCQSYLRLDKSPAES